MLPARGFFWFGSRKGRIRRTRAGAARISRADRGERVLRATCLRMDGVLVQRAMSRRAIEERGIAIVRRPSSPSIRASARPLRQSTACWTRWFAWQSPRQWGMVTNPRVADRLCLKPRSSPSRPPPLRSVAGMLARANHGVDPEPGGLAACRQETRNVPSTRRPGRRSTCHRPTNGGWEDAAGEHFTVADACRFAVATRTWAPSSGLGEVPARRQYLADASFFRDRPVLESAGHRCGNVGGSRTPRLLRPGRSTVQRAGVTQMSLANPSARPIYPPGVRSSKRCLASIGRSRPLMKVCIDSRVMPWPRVSALSCS